MAAASSRHPAGATVTHKHGGWYAGNVGGGFDHPERLCPSVDGNNHKCGKCNGTGHYDKDCIAKSKEVRDKEKQAQKGGKGKGSEFFHAGKGGDNRRGAYALSPAAASASPAQSPGIPTGDQEPTSQIATGRDGRTRWLGMVGRSAAPKIVDCDGNEKATPDISLGECAEWKVSRWKNKGHCKFAKSSDEVSVSNAKFFVGNDASLF